MRAARAFFDILTGSLPAEIPVTLYLVRLDVKCSSL